MIRIHREGKATIAVIVVLSIILLFLNSYFMPHRMWVSLIPVLFLLVVVLQFFRNPVRKISNRDENLIYAPADGKIVTIEKVLDDEGVTGEWTQVSIFMSPTNVHVNRHPCSGTVSYQAYHPGKYLVAWHPKSSTENERTTVIYDTAHGFLKLRQIAGAMARRIVCYAKAGDAVVAGEELGFIKFGSRVDLLLPPNVKIDVAIDDIVKGNITTIGEFV